LRGGFTGLATYPTSFPAEELPNSAFWLSPDKIGGLQQAVLRRIFTDLHSEFTYFSISYKDTPKYAELQDRFVRQGPIFNY
jgi:hypothetical protein